MKCKKTQIGRLMNSEKKFTNNNNNTKKHFNEEIEILKNNQIEILEKNLKK